MTASEFAFLAMGLILGVASGAALVETLRARPAAPREVRVTVIPDAIPRRRATTLADDAFSVGPAEPARGGPADRRGGGPETPPNGTERRTPVRADPMVATMDVPAMTRPTTPVMADGRVDGIVRDTAPRAALVGVPVSGGEDPMLTALRTSAATMAAAAMRRGTATTVDSTSQRSSAAVAVADAPAATSVAVLTAVAARPQPFTLALAADRPPPTPPDALADGSLAPADDPDAASPCADARRVAAERCELAVRARGQATVAADAVRTAQRAYDTHEATADQASERADPRAVRQAKDHAQAQFRAGRTGALTSDEVEAAARAWLIEINRINAEARDAAATVVREREAARALGANMERIALEAEAARIGAETAEAACLAAREALADCEELARAGTEARPPVETPPGDGAVEPVPHGYGTGGTPRIFRLVRGDRAAMTELVAELGGADPEERRRWQVAISDLVDAIVASSIEATSLDFPPDDPFWGPFTASQDREIAEALGSLGYRFDGLGGWVDGRVPSQRDLSLALGYAGLDPMRMRHWPTETEMAALFRDVTVAADVHLANEAGDLTLGELVTMLGRRADGLAEVWNQWGRLRPLLLEER